MIRMLSVLSRGEFGGAERSTVAALRNTPDDMRVHCILLSPGSDEIALRDAGLTTVAFPEHPPTLAARTRLVKLLDHQLTAFSPDLIYATGNKAAMTSVVPATLRRIPLVWNKCDSWYDGRGAGVLARLCTKVVAPTRACGVGIPADRLAVIDPVLPISPSFSAPTPRPPATIGSIGRLEPRKGHEDVIAAAALLRDRWPEIRVLIVGASVSWAPGYLDLLRTLADRHKIGDRVEFLGHVPQIEDVLAQLTLLVSASYRDPGGRGGEAFGLAVAEACWAGLPVVVTDSGGTTEHVRHGVNGLVVPPREPSQLAAATLELLEDPRRAALMGAEAAQIARKRFEPERTAAHLFTELRSCVRPAP